MKVAVLGIGGSGSAALRSLAQAGHEAVGFEQFGLGHAMGSSHGHSRIIRRTYPDAFHTRLMACAYEFWDELEKESGEELFVKCGGITFGAADDPKLASTRQALEEAGLEFEALSRDETAARFPAIDIGEGATAIFQNQSGFLRATRCVLAQARLAMDLKARIHEQTPVLRIEEQSRQVLVSTAAATEAFDAVIVTAGPWIGKFAVLPVRTALRQVVYLGIARQPENFMPGKLPVWIDYPSDHYGFPIDGELPGIKVASHDAGWDFDPDHPDRPLMDEPRQHVLRHAMKRFPNLSGEVLSAQACLYTTTPDERFVLDFAPGSQRVVICSGCSGHGFKFTILLGKLCADMATRGLPGPAAEWRLARF